MPFTYPIIWCWALFVLVWLAYGLFTKKTQWRQDPRGRLGYTALLSAGFLLIYFSYMQGSPNVLGEPLFSSETVSWIGVLVTAIGLAITLWARAILGGNWSASMDLKEKHALVTYGPYSIVRHPIYTGLLLMFIGSALALPTFGTLLAFVCALISCLIRIPKEDALMAREFSKEHASYRKRVRALVPFVW